MSIELFNEHMVEGSLETDNEVTMEAESESGAINDENLSLIIPKKSLRTLDISSLNEENNNLVVAFCLDGTVYALDGDSGGILWKTVGSFTDGPLLGKQQHRGEMGEFEYFIEPLGEGAIFQVQTGGGVTEEIKRLPFTLKSLVHLSPVHWQESAERALYLLAKRESSIFVLDLVSGRVTRRQFKQHDSEGESEMAPLERATLLVGRTDYHVQGFDEGTLEADWEITLTQFKSLHPPELSPAAGDSFYATFNGHLVSKRRDGPWIAELGSPVLQIFKPAVTTKGFITLQEIELKGSARADNHVLFDRSKATFYFDDLVNVGLLRTGKSGSNETGQAMFVLPQSHYPILGGEKRKKKTLQGSEATELILANGHKFVGAQRVTRQSIIPPVKLLDHETGGTQWSVLFYAAIAFVTFLYVLRWLRPMWGRRAPQSALEVSEEVLGFGSHGTVVFRGKFDGRPVAVKRLLSDFYSLADREISLLQAHDSHPNVIRYFYREQQERFILVALELAQCTLYEFINPEDESSQGRAGLARDSLGDVDKVNLLQQIMSGLQFLHEKGLIHRDLKPQNILLQKYASKGNNSTRVKVLISDFGLSRRVVEMESSFHATAKAAGTLGWRAPEIIFNEESDSFRAAADGVGPMKIGKSVDIFAAGLIFYFVLSEGRHAFGSRLVRELNISQGRLQVEDVHLGAEAKDLILTMLQRKGKDRPTAAQVLTHPFFWSGERRLEFICAVSDVLEAEEQSAKREQAEKAAGAPPGFTVPAVELPMRDAIDAIGPSGLSTTNSPTWHKELARPVFQDLTKHRYYMVNKVHDLLRAIRNKRNHFHETPDDVKAMIGGSVGEAWGYFEGRFPRLLMESYKVMRQFNPKSLEQYM